MIPALSRASPPPQELVLAAIAIAGGAAGLLLLMTTSTRELSWASAVVPVRLLIVLIVCWTVVGLQVLPPVLTTVRSLLSQRFEWFGARRRVKGLGHEQTLNLVAIQQKQLLALEAEVAERQRALQENMLRLKLMTTPLLQVRRPRPHPEPTPHNPTLTSPVPPCPFERTPPL